MASTLTDRLSRLVKTMRGQARITESNVQDMLREVRMALLEADVALPVVRDFIARVKEKALGQEVVGSLNPGQALVGIVHKELAATMGDGRRPTQPGRAAAGGDPDGRPAGRRQDHDHRQAGQAPDREAQEEGADGLGRRLPAGRDRAAEDGDRAGRRRVVPVDAPTRSRATSRWPRSTTRKRHYFDVLLVDTAGRLAIDEALMAEIRELHAALNPVETLFVVDAMQGQDAVNTAKAFKDALPLTGVVLTKLDGDSRGGAALSVRQITGAPIKFAGVVREDRRPGGLRRRTPCRPRAGHGRHRRAGRGGAEGRRHRRPRRSWPTRSSRGGGFDLNDFLRQITQMKKMGGLAGLMDKLPSQLTGQGRPAPTWTAPSATCGAWKASSTR